MRPIPTDRTFRQALVLALAAAGCSTHKPAEPNTESTDDVAVDEGTELPGLPGLPGADSPPACDPTPLLADGQLKPAQTVDGVALRKRADRMGQSTREVVATDGILCEDKAEDSLCTTRAQELWMSDPIRRDCYQVGCEQTNLVWSNGDEVGVADSPDALKAFLGPIDTAAEARLIAWSQRFDVECMPTEDPDGGWRVSATQNMGDCPIKIDTVTLNVAPDGTVTELGRTEGPPGPCVGRLAPGLCSLPEQAAAVGAWLANAAHMEAVAARAFTVLAAELTHHGAPVALVEAAHRAADDEVRHAQHMAALAARYGYEMPAVELRDTPVRSLRELAIDNAAEGLGREVWGSLLALWQSQHAADPHVRAAMARIALDEVGHAELSRALHAWLLPQLSPADQDQVHAAKQRAWASIEADEPANDELCDVLGFPRQPAQLLAAAREAGLAA